MDELPELSVKHLRAMVALARFESFVAAAAYLGISQPGLTRLIQQAEERIGAQLFARGTKKVHQTEAGRTFVQASERMLGDLSQQVMNARASDGQLRGQISIASIMSIAHQVLPQALVRFRGQHPQTHVHVREGLARAVHEDVSRGHVDFGIANVDGIPDNVAVEAVGEESCFLVLPKEHCLGKLRVVALKHLADTPLISMPVEAGLRTTIDMAAKEQGLSLNHSIITNQFGSLFEYTANGLGAAIVPATALPPSNQYAVTIKPLRPQMKRRIGILYPKDNPPSNTAKIFLDVFRPLFLAAVRQRRRE